MLDFMIGGATRYWVLGVRHLRFETVSFATVGITPNYVVRSSGCMRAAYSFSTCYGSYLRLYGTVEIEIRRKNIVTVFGKKGSTGLGTIVRESLIGVYSKRGIMWRQRRKIYALQHLGDNAPGILFAP